MVCSDVRVVVVVRVHLVRIVVVIMLALVGSRSTIRRVVVASVVILGVSSVVKVSRLVVDRRAMVVILMRRFGIVVLKRAGQCMRRGNMGRGIICRITLFDMLLHRSMARLRELLLIISIQMIEGIGTI